MCGLHSSSATVLNCDFGDRRSCNNVYSAMLRGFEKSAAQGAGIDTALGQQVGRSANGDARLQLRNLVAAQHANPVAAGTLVFGEESDCSLLAQVGRLP